MLPIVISAPHAQTEIKDPKIRKRIKLTDYEIWKCSDPYTGELTHFTCATFKHIAKTHRLICDFNRAPNPTDAFHEQDFFKRKVFHPGKKFSNKTKEQLIKNHWQPYHNAITESIKKLDSQGHKKILLVDYHNTSGDHPLNPQDNYMASFIISNLGQKFTGKKTSTNQKTTLPATKMQFFKKSLESNLGISVEINAIFHGGYNLKWYKTLQKQLKTKAKIYAIQFEYNLDFIVNPISKKVDRKALAIMQTAINKSLIELYNQL